MPARLSLAALAVPASLVCMLGSSACKACSRGSGSRGRFCLWAFFGLRHARPGLCGPHLLPAKAAAGQVLPACARQLQCGPALTLRKAHLPPPRSFIDWCRVGTEVTRLVPGGEPCIHLSLQASLALQPSLPMGAATQRAARRQRGVAWRVQGCTHTGRQ